MSSVHYTQDNLEVCPELLKNVTVKAGTSLARGDLVKLTGGVVELFTTGSEPYSVMFDTVDATGGAKVGRAYREAELLASSVNFGTGTLAEVVDALDALDIHLV